MRICPITYENIPAEGRYSTRGLRLLSPQLRSLNNFPYSAEEQRKEAEILTSKLSIQGIQPKLSAVVSIKKSIFEIVDRGGRYILKPQIERWKNLPENEDLTMRLAEIVGIEVPVHGLLYSKDGSMTYFIRRFDRRGQKGKLHLEDFAQLSGETRDTKYDSTTEKVAKIIEHFCTFPAVEKVKLFERILFSFLVGNEDMHLKNFSLIVRNEKIELSPAYDLLNSTIAIANPKEELALPVAGKKSRLTREDLFDYLASERLGLNQATIAEVIRRFSLSIQKWFPLIEKSFLPREQKDDYRKLVIARAERLALKVTSPV